MYIIVNKTKVINFKHEGSFPIHAIEDMLENDEDLIIISYYSNTIKVPYLDTDTNNHGQTKSSHDWDYKSYKLPFVTLPPKP